MLLWTLEYMYLFKSVFFRYKSLGFPDGSDSKKSACNVGDLGWIPGWEDPLEKDMATHSSILAWRIPWKEEPGWLQSMGSQRVGDWVILIRYICRSGDTVIMLFLDNVTFSRNPTNANSKIVSLFVAHLILLCNTLCISHLFKIVSFSRTGIMKCIFCLNFFTGGSGGIDWFQIGKRVCQGCMSSSCLFNVYEEYIMQNARLDEAQAGTKIAGRNINNLRHADDTTLMAKVKKN